MEKILRLRYHHLPEIYAYMFYGSREEFDRARKLYKRINRETYRDRFIDNVADLMEKFWNGYYAKLEVVAAQDDFCESCMDETCEGRNIADKLCQDDPNKIFWLELGLYDAEEIKKMMKEIYREERGKYPPEVK